MDEQLGSRTRNGSVKLFFHFSQSSHWTSSSGCELHPKKHAEGSDLAVADTKVGGIIKEKLGINCVHGAAVNELMRGIRSQIDALLPAPGPEGRPPNCMVPSRE